MLDLAWSMACPFGARCYSSLGNIDTSTFKHLGYCHQQFQHEQGLMNMDRTRFACLSFPERKKPIFLDHKAYLFTPITGTWIPPYWKKKSLSFYFCLLLKSDWNLCPLVSRLSPTHFRSHKAKFLGLDFLIVRGIIKFPSFGYRVT